MEDTAIRREPDGQHTAIRVRGLAKSYFAGQVIKNIDLSVSHDAFCQVLFWVIDAIYFLCSRKGRENTPVSGYVLFCGLLV